MKDFFAVLSVCLLGSLLLAVLVILAIWAVDSFANLEAQPIWTEPMRGTFAFAFLLLAACSVVVALGLTLARGVQ